MYGLVLMKCARHPMHISPTCPICASYESEKKRINATNHELIKQPCGVHTASVSPACPTCILWAAHCNDLKGERSIDLSSTEPDNTDLCRFVTDQVSFERIRQGTDNFNSDCLAVMTQEEQVVDDLMS